MATRDEILADIAKLERALSDPNQEKQYGNRRMRRHSTEGMLALLNHKRRELEALEGTRPLARIVYLGTSKGL